MCSAWVWGDVGHQMSHTTQGVGRAQEGRPALNDATLARSKGKAALHAAVCGWYGRESSTPVSIAALMGAAPALYRTALMFAREVSIVGHLPCKCALCFRTSCKGLIGPLVIIFLWQANSRWLLLQARSGAFNYLLKHRNDCHGCC